MNFLTGWKDDEGETLVPHLTSDTLRGWLDRVEQLNAIERKKGTSDEWFLLAGNSTCTRECLNCNKSTLHHWEWDDPAGWTDEKFDDNNEAQNELATQLPIACIHCDTRRTETSFDDEE